MLSVSGPHHPNKLFTGRGTEEPGVTVTASHNSGFFLPGTRADSYDAKSDLSPGEDKKHIQVKKRTLAQKQRWLQVGTGDRAVREPRVLPGGESTGSGRALSPLSREKSPHHPDLTFPRRKSGIIIPATYRVVGKIRGAN